MTLIELQGVLSERIEKTLSPLKSQEEKELENEKSILVAKLARHMISNADIILRADKLAGKHARIDSVVGDANVRY